MATLVTRISQQPQPSIQTATNLIQIINSDPILAGYFSNSCSPPEYGQLAYSLMLDGLRYRTANLPAKNIITEGRQEGALKNRQDNKNMLGNNKQGSAGYSPTRKQAKTPSKSKSKDKHYNVSYIKHNRFLSPSQRKQLITPKITEVIPVTSAPLIIFGKPRVKVDQQCGCPYHNNEEECLKSIPYGDTCQPRKMPVRVVHIREDDGNYTTNTHPLQAPYQLQNRQLQKYSSTPNLHNHHHNHKNKNIPQQTIQHLQKTKKPEKSSKPSKQKQQNLDITNSQFKKQKNNKNNIINDQNQNNNNIGNVIYVDRIVEIQNRVPGQLRIVQSPKNVYRGADYQDFGTDQDGYLPTRYLGDKRKSEKSGPKQVQSKIKFLIERDKKNKQMQKNLKKQQEQINNLQKMLKQDRSQLDFRKTKSGQQQSMDSYSFNNYQLGNPNNNNNNNNSNNNNNHLFSKNKKNDYNNQERIKKVEGMQSLQMSSSSNSNSSSSMSMMDSDIVQKYRSNAQGQELANPPPNHNQQTVGKEGTKTNKPQHIKANSAAYFGNTQQKQNEQDSCFCENSYDEHSSDQENGEEEDDEDENEEHEVNVKIDRNKSEHSQDVSQDLSDYQ